MDEQTVPVPPDGTARLIDVNEQHMPLLEQTAVTLLAERCHELHEGVDDGRVTRHVADLLIGRLREAIDARAEIIAAAGEDLGYLSIPTLRLVGERAIERERERLAEEWECGGEDLRGLSNDTDRLAELDDLLVRAGSICRARGEEEA